MSVGWIGKELKVLTPVSTVYSSGTLGWREQPWEYHKQMSILDSRIQLHPPPPKKNPPNQQKKKKKTPKKKINPDKRINFNPLFKQHTSH